jgi:5-methylcytosine-specific restriction endonuclease McrA
MPGEMRELLSYLQSLLGNEGRDEIHVLNMGLQALKPVLEKRKFGATSRPRLTQSLRNSNPRHIPAHVKREVWTRDGGQCTFVSSSGHRCEARRHLEFEHELEVARGGQATVTNIRLRSRAHNQLAAEQTYGAEFMRNKRIAAQEARELERETRRARTEAEREARRAERARTEEEKARAREAEELEKDPDRSVVPWLRALGVPLPEARQAASAVEHMTDSTPEERVKAAFAAYGRVRFAGARRPSNSYSPASPAESCPNGGA